MSNADAIKMGSAFVEFFADREKLDRMTGALAGDVKSWATAASADIATNISAGFSVAQAAAINFGASAATGMAIVSNAIQKTSAWLIDVPNRFLALSGGIGTIASNIGDIARGAGIANFALGGTAKVLQRMGFETKFVDKLSAGMKTLAWDSRRAQFGIDLMLAPLRGVQSVAAKLAAMGLGAFNIGIRSLGGYTKDTEWLASSLNRTASNAMRAVFSFRTLIPLIRAAGVAGRAASAIATLPFRAVRAVTSSVFNGRAAMRGAQLASVASLGAMAADNVGASAEQEQQESGGFGRFMQPILTGLMIGGPIGVAAAGLGIYMASSLGKGAEEGGGAFDKLIGRARSWGAWIGGMFGQVKDKIVATFEKVTAGSEPFLSRLEKALIPLTHAIENVWLPGMLNAIETIGSFFKKNNNDMEQSWSDWILGGIRGIADFVGNIDLHLKIAAGHVGMWVVNSGTYVSDFFDNAVSLVSWFGDNWFDVLDTMADYAMSVFLNIGENIKNTFTGLWDFASGGFTGELKMDWKGLTDGAVSSIKDLPKEVRSEMLKTTPELEALYAQLGKRRADARKGGLIADVEKAADAVKPGKSRDTAFGAISARSQEGYSLLAKLQNQTGQRDPVADNTKMLVDEAKKTNRKLDKIAQKEGGLLAWAIPG